jgi:hypothetical protein
MQNQVVKSYGPGVVGATIKKINFALANDSGEQFGP